MFPLCLRPAAGRTVTFACDAVSNGISPTLPFTAAPPAILATEIATPLLQPPGLAAAEEENKVGFHLSPASSVGQGVKVASRNCNRSSEVEVLLEQMRARKVQVVALQELSLSDASCYTGGFVLVTSSSPGYKTALAMPVAWEPYTSSIHSFVVLLSLSAFDLHPAASCP